MRPLSTVMSPAEMTCPPPINDECWKVPVSYCKLSNNGKREVLFELTLDANENVDCNEKEIFELRDETVRMGH